MSERADEIFLSESSNTRPVGQSGKAPASVLFATFHENERPLVGLAGLVDWRLCGVISESLRRGVISGHKGEWAYFPILTHGKPKHLFLYGQGESAVAGQREPVSATILQELAVKLKKLNLSEVIISAQDTGLTQTAQLKTAVQTLAAQGVSVCTTP